MSNTFEFLGQTIETRFQNISKGQVVSRAENSWQVQSWRGEVIVAFETEQEANQWWTAFQSANRKRMKAEAEAAKIKAAEKKAARIKAAKAAEARASELRRRSPHYFQDPLMPQSEKYDLPETDLR